MIFNIQWTFGS